MARMSDAAFVRSVAKHLARRNSGDSVSINELVRFLHTTTKKTWRYDYVVNALLGGRFLIACKERRYWRDDMI